MFKQTGFTLFLVVICLILVSGCETSKGAVTGIAKGIAVGTVETGKGVADGACKDTSDSVNFIQKVDEWIKDNLW